ncbi:MAG: transposase, partial [Deltaproteobacteria bacterium]|nr:transposase [Deltaproteobacteria bacterium]
MRAIKEECLWLREWKNAEELKSAFEAWVEDYNKNYLHSTLGYK